MHVFAIYSIFNILLPDAPMPHDVERLDVSQQGHFLVFALHAPLVVDNDIAHYTNAMHTE